MTYEDFTSAMNTLRNAKNSLRLQRETGNCAAAIERNQAIQLMNNAEYTLTGDYSKDCQREAQRWNEAGAQRTGEDIAASRKMSARELDPLNPGYYKSQHIMDLETVARAKKDKKNAARRAKHQAYTDCGMKRVRGALGGVYYE
jgi:hypothetical protein